MPEHLFSDYLTNPESYEGSQRLWHELFYGECLPPNERHLWVPWLGLSADGNPIFRVVHVSQKRGLSIHQEHYLEPKPIFGLVHRVFDERGMADGPIEHWMILCELSREIVPQAKDAMLLFLSKERDGSRPNQG